MSKWLSDEWFDESRAIWSTLPPRPGLSARVQCEISGAPAGRTVYHAVVEDGRLVDSGARGVEDPDVSVSLTRDDAQALHRGDLDANVAYMQGRMKVAGGMSVVIPLLAAARGEAVREARRRIASVTEF